MASANSPYEVGYPKLVLWDNTEGQGEEGGGKGGFRKRGDTCRPVTDLC